MPGPFSRLAETFSIVVLSKRIAMRTIILALLFSLQAAFAADFAGSWKMIAQSPNGDLPFNLVLEKQGEGYKGEIRGGSNSFAIENVAADGDKLKFTIKHDMGPIPVELALTGTQLEGAGTLPDGSGKVPMKGSRDQAAAPAASAAAATPAGRWKIVAKSPDGATNAYTLEVKEDAGAWRGQLTTANDDVVALTEVKFAEAVLSFKLPVDEGTFEVSMTVEGDSGKGNYKTPQGQKGEFTAARAK